MIDALPGSLVVLKNRWNLSSHLVGLVMGCDGDLCLVMWSEDDLSLIKFVWHVTDALLVVDDANMPSIKQRRLVNNAR